jgi:hypothetical protein
MLPPGPSSCALLPAAEQARRSVLLFSKINMLAARRPSHTYARLDKS